MYDEWNNIRPVIVFFEFPSIFRRIWVAGPSYQISVRQISRTIPHDHTSSQTKILKLGNGMQYKDGKEEDINNWS